ncbi:hypothetical protein B566_EDAN009245 [Ephemera danica]|nr:hypothetical protein B566_EDAN009245 [Ephemera danica]
MTYISHHISYCKGGIISGKRSLTKFHFIKAVCMSTLSKFYTAGSWQMNTRGVVVVAVSTVAGLGLIGILAHYLRRRRPSSTRGTKHTTYNDVLSGGGAGSVVSGASSRRTGSLYRQMSTVGEKGPLPVSGAALDVAGIGGMGGLINEQLTPQQLGAMGELSTFFLLFETIEVYRPIIQLEYPLFR